jgi:DNA gyrase/topoisomerase IV subunit B
VKERIGAGDLQGLQHVRKRPGMYLGSLSGEGVSAVDLLRALVLDALEEASSNAEMQIVATISLDSARLVDNGVGLPLVAADGRPHLASLLVRIGGGRSSRRGQIHFPLVAAMCERMTVVSRSSEGHQTASIEVGRGRIETTATPGRADPAETGTAIEIWPDPTVFEGQLWPLPLPDLGQLVAPSTNDWHNSWWRPELKSRLRVEDER